MIILNLVITKDVVWLKLILDRV